MVTTKKVSAPKSVASVVETPAKPVAAKKTVRTVAPATPVAVTAAPAKAAVKSAAKPASKPKASTAKTQATAAQTQALMDIEQRNHYVQVAAFYIAERRGFAPGNPAEDWAAAEIEVDRLIASNNFAL